MKRYFLSLLVGLLLLPALRAVMQGETIILDITGVNATQMPVITITASVVDNTGQTLAGLEAEDFTLTGPLADRAQIVRVENITEDDLTLAAVLVIDTSSSVAGEPFRRIQEAARLFVESVGPDDSVAIITFDTDARLVQDFTSDKTVLLNAIDGLRYGGKTALYDAAVLGVEIAAGAPSPRRAVILLTDGQEFGGVSDSGRGDGLQRAIELGVPVYTIGLGFGTDRSYLRDIANNTNGDFHEAPTPDELVGIYAGLAQLFRTQYVVTLDFSGYDTLADAGATYDFGLQVNTGAVVSNAATSTVRVPIPVPIISLPEGIFATPIAEPVTVTPIIQADDAITSVEFVVNDSVTTGDSLTIDPVTYQPGPYPLTIRVTDATGDTTRLDTQFEIAALPSEVTLNWTPGDAPISEPRTVSISASGQTPVVSTVYVINTPDGASAYNVVDDTTDLNFSFDPFDLAPGSYILRVAATNAGGITTTVEQGFSVAAIAPRVTGITGIAEGQEIAAPVEVAVTATLQSGATLASTTLTAGTTALPGLTIDPMALQPGSTPITVTLTDSNGAVAQTTVTVVIAALAPIVELTAPPSPVTAPASVPVSITSQTFVIGATYSFDSGAGVSLTQNADGSIAPIPIDPVALGDGEHTLAVRIVNASQQVTTAEIAFTVQNPTPTPTVTPSPTPTFTPTLTPTPSPTFTATLTPTPTIDITGTAVALANIAESTANAVATANAAATGAAVATSDAQSTLVAQATSDAGATQSALATQTANFASTLNAEATAAAQGTLDFQSTLDAQVTAAVQGTANAEATLNAEATAAAQVTLDAQATLNAQATAAQVTLDAQATLNAQATAAQVTLDAQSTASAELTRSAGATATVNAAATASLLATQTAIAAATESELLTATAGALATLDAQATVRVQRTLDAQSTAVAEANAAAFATATARAQETLDAAATANAAATNDALAALTATADAQNATLTAAARLTQDAMGADDATATQNALATQTAIAEATQNAQATSVALANAATLAAENTATQNAAATLTAGAASASANQTATAIAGATLTAQPTPTTTPLPSVATLTPPPAPGTDTTTGDILQGIGTDTIVLLCIIGLVILLVIIVVLFMRGRGPTTP